MDNEAFTGDGTETGLRQRSNGASPDEAGAEAEVEIDTTNKLHVKRRLGLISAIAYITGNIIGSGIFVSPKAVLSYSGSVGLCLVMWAVCGVVGTCSALIFVELGTLLPKSGADYIYFLKAYGPIPAFLFVWITAFFVTAGANVIKGLAFAEYISVVIFDDCGPPEIYKKLIATITILTVFLINLYSVRLSARVQVFFLVAKLTGLAVIIVGGIISIAQGKTQQLAEGFEGSTTSPANIAFAFYSGMWAYTGWRNMNFAVEEVHEPQKTLPRAILISMALVTVVYLAVNISYFTLLTTEEFLSSWAVAVNWAQNILGPAYILIPIVVACSVFGSQNGACFSISRLLFAAGREEHLPEFMSYIHVQSGIPLPCLLIWTTLSIILVFPSDIGSLMNFIGFTDWIIFGAGAVALIVLRFKMKDAPRPVKIPIFIPVLVTIVSLFMTIAPFTQNPRIEIIYALVYIACSFIFYIPFIHFKLKIPGFDKITTFVQLFLEVGPTDYKSIVH